MSRDHHHCVHTECSCDCRTCESAHGTERPPCDCVSCERLRRGEQPPTAAQMERYMPGVKRSAAPTPPPR